MFGLLVRRVVGFLAKPPPSPRSPLAQSPNLHMSSFTLTTSLHEAILCTLGCFHDVAPLGCSNTNTPPRECTAPQALIANSNMQFASSLSACSFAGSRMALEMFLMGE